MPDLLISFCNTGPRRPLLAVVDHHLRALHAVDLTGDDPTILGATGLCRLGDQVWVALQADPARIAVLDRDLRVVELRPLELASDPHALLAVDGRVLVASSGSNAVVEIDPASFAERRLITTSQEPVGQDLHHLNGLCLWNGRLLATVFGPRPAEGWGFARDGQVLDLSERRLIARGLLHPHSLAAVDGRLLLLESNASKILEIGERPPAIVTRGCLAGYLRGLARFGDALYVGASAVRSRSRHAGARNAAAAWVAPELESAYLNRIDLAGGGITTLRLPGHLQEVFDILPLG